MINDSVSHYTVNIVTIATRYDDESDENSITIRDFIDQESANMLARLVCSLDNFIDLVPNYRNVDVANIVSFYPNANIHVKRYISQFIEFFLNNGAYIKVYDSNGDIIRYFNDEVMVAAALLGDVDQFAFILEQITFQIPELFQTRNRYRINDIQAYVLSSKTDINTIDNYDSNHEFSKPYHYRFHIDYMQLDNGDIIRLSTEILNHISARIRYSELQSKRALEPFNFNISYLNKTDKFINPYDSLVEMMNHVTNEYLIRIEKFIVTT